MKTIEIITNCKNTNIRILYQCNFDIERDAKLNLYVNDKCILSYNPLDTYETPVFIDKINKLYANKLIDDSVLDTLTSQGIIYQMFQIISDDWLYFIKED